MTSGGPHAPKVLVAIDLSQHAEATLDFVLSLRWPAEASFVVVSAVHPPILAHAEAAAFAPDDLAGLYESVSAAYLEAATGGARRLEDAGLHAEARVVRGDPREVLIETARRERAELIVVGSHGRTGVARLVMGTVAAHVVAHAPCSVLVVKARGRHS